MTTPTNVLRARLETDELTFELGVKAAEAGIAFVSGEMPDRCLDAKEFHVGWLSVGPSEEQARMILRLEDEKEKLTFKLGVETAEAGVALAYWPYRCVRSKEFRRGYLSAADVVVAENLTMRENADGTVTVIDKNIN